MELLFGIAILVLLAATVFELRAIRLELARIPLHLRKTEDQKDSPTINVNVGTLPVQTVKEGSTEAAAKDEDQGNQAGPPDTGIDTGPDEGSAAKPETALRAVAVNATQSGLVAVKCPSCQAENSSFRTECFNCGARLR